MRAFVATFGRPPTCQADAPGRVNLMGEHTDYNGGRVLPIATPQRAHVWLAARDDGQVRACSTAFGSSVESYTLGAERRGRGWIDYLQGVTCVLARSGRPVSGFDAWLHSDVPMGSGLGSSAAFEVAVLRGLRTLLRLQLDDIELARLAQRVETEFVGANVGIMDQMAASLADETTALLLHTVDLRVQRVPIAPTLELAVIDSGVRHAHATGGYNERRAQCEEAARRLGVRWLCDMPLAELQRVDALPEPFSMRARHVVTEHARVPETARALRHGDEAALRELFARSHASQRDAFGVSVPEVDALVERAAADPDVVGARLTGGGFGGSVVLLVRRARAHPAAHRIAKASGRDGVVVVLPRAPSAAGVRGFA